MNTTRALLALLLLLAAPLVALGCAGDGPPELDEEQRREWAELQRLRGELAGARGALAALREQLAEVEAAEGSRPASAGERSRREGAVNERQRSIQELSHRYGTRLVAFIDSFGPAELAPLPPQRRQAIRMKSDEDMAVAAEWIERGGDYRRAIEIYETQRRLDPEYEPLLVALRQARDMRQVTAARFAGVERGMSQAEVREVLGPVNLRLVRSFPERGVEAWLYPQEKGGTAAVYFRRRGDGEPLEVYETVFELPPSEATADGAGAPGAAPRSGA